MVTMKTNTKHVNNVTKNVPNVQIVPITVLYVAVTEFKVLNHTVNVHQENMKQKMETVKTVVKNVTLAKTVLISVLNALIQLEIQPQSVLVKKDIMTITTSLNVNFVLHNANPVKTALNNVLNVQLTEFLTQNQNVLVMMDTLTIMELAKHVTRNVRLV